MAENKIETYYETKISFDQTKYETKQYFATSADGTKVPYFITYRKGIEQDRSHPTLMHGYGGFNVNILPGFSVTTASWLEMGGIFVESVLRGGAEYGRKWHEAGMRHNKQNVFNDFIAIAKDLISKGYTSESKLAIMGGSNGGLLVASCMLQQPDLYGAVLCLVPVTDMLRFHKFTVGKYWTEEYGNAEKSTDDFQSMIKYSPLHNVKPKKYPSTLIWTADHDDRVVSAHAKKFAATLQEKDIGNNPLLLHIETSAGHGAGKPTAKRIDQIADMFSFLHKVLDMDRDKNI